MKREKKQEEVLGLNFKKLISMFASPGPEARESNRAASAWFLPAALRDSMVKSALTPVDRELQRATTPLIGPPSSQPRPTWHCVLASSSHARQAGIGLLDCPEADTRQCCCRAVSVRYPLSAVVAAGNSQKGKNSCPSPHFLVSLSRD